jgi:sphingolipid 4-desaturase/C4-monooxygenase
LNPNKDFYHSEQPDPHKIRIKQILREHPEVRQLIGRNPWSALYILSYVIILIGMAILLRNSPWWLILVLSYCIGAFVSHGLFAMVHEATHNLIFKKTGANMWMGLLCNLPQPVPSYVSFKRYHLKHHAYMGEYEFCSDLPYEWERKLGNSGWIGKFLWLTIYPFAQITRTFRIKEIFPVDKWVILNYGIQILFNVAVVYFLGWHSFFFLLFSLLFSVGLHPVGARWIQEHYVMREGQETNSYYGPLNSINFNIGYHNEHHDLPSVPWNKLPELKKTAPEFYDPLFSHKSWTVLFFRFIFDLNPKISMYDRIVRK